MIILNLSVDTADNVGKARTHALSAVMDRVHPAVAKYPHCMYKVFFLVSFKI
jgi:hypothetical protein